MIKEFDCPLCFSRMNWKENQAVYRCKCDLAIGKIYSGWSAWRYPSFDQKIDIVGQNSIEDCIRILKLQAFQ